MATTGTQTLTSQYYMAPGLRAATIQVVLTNPQPVANPTIDLSAAAYGGFSTIHGLMYPVTPTAYDAAKNTGGTNVDTVVAHWAAVTNGEFAITIDGVAVEVVGAGAVDFSGLTTMAQVATAIQTALNTATGTTETVTWSTDHFVITSSITGPASEVSLTTATAAGVGTDISGVAAGTINLDMNGSTVTPNGSGKCVGIHMSTTTATVLVKWCDNNAVADGALIAVPNGTEIGDNVTFDLMVLGN